MSIHGRINETLFTKVSSVVSNSQNGPSNHMKNMKLLEILYNSSDFEQFVYIYFTVYTNVVEKKFQNPYVQHILEFLAKFVAYIATGQNIDENDLEDDPPTHPFLKRVLEYIINFHDDPSEDCKYNTSSFVRITLDNLGGNAVLDNNIFSLISESLLENIQDPNALIRVQALSGLMRFQNPTNPECQVVPAYIKCLNDSNYLVRQKAVEKIAPTRKILTKLAKKIRDPHPAVQIAAFTHLADIGIKYLKIEDRQFILKCGFAEVNKLVKKTFLEYLFPKWLTSLNGSYLDLLKLIKLDSGEEDLTNTEELSNHIMETLFKTESIDKLIEILPLEESKVIPEDQIESELALYWNIMVKYLTQSEVLDEYLDKIVPELTIFCNYIERLVDNKFSKAKDEWEYLHFQYILYYLFDMAENFDLCEQVGRSTLDKLIRKVLRKYRCKPRLLNKMIQIGIKLASNVDSFINDICLIISDIWQPLIDLPPNQEDNFVKDFRIAELSVKLNVLEENCEKAVIESDFEKAHELKTQMEQCRKEIEQLKCQDLPTGQTRVTTENPDTICWCLDLLCVILESNSIKELSPSLETWRQEFLMPLVTSKNAEIEWRAFKCLSIYCIFDEKLMAEQFQTLYLPLVSCKIIPNFNKEILIQSIAIVTDLIRLHGTNLFQLENKSNANRLVHNITTRRLYTEDVDEVNDVNNSLTVDVIIDAFLDLLNDEDSDISDTAATALAKLILNGFSVNSMMMTRLLLQWFNPAKEENLQQRLGLIIKAYIDKIPESKKIAANSVVPIITNIVDAPQTSPLANIDMNKVIKFMVAITDSEIHGLMHIHTELARILLREISLRPAQISTIYFAKLLYQLNITADNSPAIKELITNVQLILEKEVLDKSSKSQLTKFVKKLSGLPVSASTTFNESSVNNSVRNSICNRKRTITEARRLSSIIDDDEEDTSSNKNPGDAREPLVSKSMRLDLGDGPDKNDQVNTAPELPTTNNHNNVEKDVEQSVELENISSNSIVSSSESDIIVSSQAHNIEKTKQNVLHQELKIVIDKAAVPECDSTNQKQLSSSESTTVPTQFKKRFKRSRRRLNIPDAVKNPKNAAKNKKRNGTSSTDPLSTSLNCSEGSQENISETSEPGRDIRNLRSKSKSSESNSTADSEQGTITKKNSAKAKTLKNPDTIAVIGGKSTGLNGIRQNSQPSSSESTNSNQSLIPQRRSTRQNNVTEIAESPNVARKAKKNGDISIIVNRNPTLTRNSSSASQSSENTGTTHSEKSMADNSRQNRVTRRSTKISETSTSFENSSSTSTSNGATSSSSVEAARKTTRNNTSAAKKKVLESDDSERNKRRLSSSVNSSNNESEGFTERSRRFSKRRRLDEKINGKILEIGISSGNTRTRSSMSKQSPT